MPPPAKARCCIYARVSTDEQAEKDLSIPFQLERCRYHAQGKGWAVVKEYTDAGESARTDYDFIVYEKELEELGITLESISEPGDASTPGELHRTAHDAGHLHLVLQEPGPGGHQGDAEEGGEGWLAP